MSRPLTAAETSAALHKLMGHHECIRLTDKDRENADREELRAYDQGDGSVLIHAHERIPTTEGMGS